MKRWQENIPNLRNRSWVRPIPFVLFIIVLILSSCVTEKKATDYFKKNDDKLAELCVERFPLPPPTIIKGDTVVVTDTIVSKVGVKIPCPEPTIDNPNPVVECPPMKTVVVTKERVDTLKVTDTRQIFALEMKLKDANKKIETLTEEKNTLVEQKAKASKWLWILIAVCGIGLGFGITKFLK